MKTQKIGRRCWRPLGKVLIGRVKLGEHRFFQKMYFWEQKAKTFEIWEEGYLCTGMEGVPAPHRKVGEADGADFAEACENYAKFNPEWAKLYDPEKQTHWGCRLFDNATDAARSFG